MRAIVFPGLTFVLIGIAIGFLLGDASSRKLQTPKEDPAREENRTHFRACIAECHAAGLAVREAAANGASCLCQEAP